jgi:hypothetical protein
MAPYRKKPVVIDAVQWFKDGDHVGVFMLCTPGRPEADQLVVCTHCGKREIEHGYIQTLEGRMRVCPSDWVIIGVKQEVYPCKADIFETTYEPVT